MNEKIKKLAGQALDAAVPETWTTLSFEQLQHFQQKFAELIVKECADFIDAHEQIDKHGEAYEIVYGSDIRRLFGVK